jgi:predicted nucleic acid-binding protein
MRLVLDTSALVGQLLRAAGRDRLGDDRLELFLPEQMWAETRVELPRRITAFTTRRNLAPPVGEQLAALCLEAVTANVVILEESIYSALQEEALARAQRDPRDWPIVACALALSAGIWTEDNDFLGVGLPTWTTQTLALWLTRHPPE